MHGSLWVQMKTSGAVSERAAKLGARAWWGVLPFTAIVTAITFQVQPQVLVNLKTWPWGFVFPALAVAGLGGVAFELVKKNEAKAFLASCAYLAGMLTSVVFGLYPMVMPARDPMYSMTVASAKAADYGLKVGLIWWTIGMILAAGYFRFVYRSFAGKVSTDGKSHGYGH